MSKLACNDVGTGGDYDRVPYLERTIESRMKFDTSLLCSYLSNKEYNDAKELAVDMVAKYGPYNMPILEVLVECPNKQVVEYIYKLGNNNTTRHALGTENIWHPENWNKAFVNAIIAGDMISYNMMREDFSRFNIDKYAHPLLIAVKWGTVAMVEHIILYMTEFDQPYLDTALMTVIREVMTSTEHKWTNMAFVKDMTKAIMYGSNETGLTITMRTQKHAMWYVSYAIKLATDAECVLPHRKEYIEFLFEKDYNLVNMYDMSCRLFGNSGDWEKCMDLFCQLFGIGLGHKMFKVLPRSHLTNELFEYIFKHERFMTTIIGGRHWALVDCFVIGENAETKELAMSLCHTEGVVHPYKYIVPLTEDTTSMESIKYHITLYKMGAATIDEAIKRATDKGDTLILPHFRPITTAEATHVISEVMTGASVYMDDANELIKLMTFEMYTDAFMDRMKAGHSIPNTSGLFGRITKAELARDPVNAYYRGKMCIGKLLYHIITHNYIVDSSKYTIDPLNETAYGLDVRGIIYTDLVVSLNVEMANVAVAAAHQIKLDEKGHNIPPASFHILRDTAETEQLMPQYKMLLCMYHLLTIMPPRDFPTYCDFKTLNNVFNNTVHELFKKMYTLSNFETPEGNLFKNEGTVRAIRGIIEYLTKFEILRTVEDDIYDQLTITSATNMKLLKFVMEKNLTHETFVSKLLNWPF